MKDGQRTATNGMVFQPGGFSPEGFALSEIFRDLHGSCLLRVLQPIGSIGLGVGRSFIEAECCHEEPKAFGLSTLQSLQSAAVSTLNGEGARVIL